MASELKSPPSHYELLGLTPSATDAEVRQAYAKLILPYGRGVHKGDRQAIESARDISSAFETLRDPKKRRSYDASLKPQTIEEPRQLRPEPFLAASKRGTPEVEPHEQPASLETLVTNASGLAASAEHPSGDESEIATIDAVGANPDGASAGARGNRRYARAGLVAAAFCSLGLVAALAVRNDHQGTTRPGSGSGAGSSASRLASDVSSTEVTAPNQSGIAAQPTRPPQAAEAASDTQADISNTLGGSVPIAGEESPRQSVDPSTAANATSGSPVTGGATHAEAATDPTSGGSRAAVEAPTAASGPDNEGQAQSAPAQAAAPVTRPSPGPSLDRTAAPMLVAGGLVDSDNPRGQFEGTVRVRFQVRTDGRIDNCRVVGTSGDAALDVRTCGLVQQRLRFRPALDSDGQPISSDVNAAYRWRRGHRR